MRLELTGSRAAVGRRGPRLLDFRESPRTAWSITASAVLLVLGLTASIGAFFIVRERERADDRRDFDERATGLESELARHFEMPVEALMSLRAALDAVNVSRTQFNRIAQDAIARYPSVALLEWAPVVAGTQRVTFENAARDDGMPDFRIRERGPAGMLVPVQERQTYVPLLYIYPATGAPFGFDLLSEPSRAARIAEVNAQPGPYATERFRLIEDPEGIYSVAIYVPLRRGMPDAPVSGYVIAIYRLNTMLEYTLQSYDTSNVAFEIWDDTDAAHPTLLFASSGAANASVSARYRRAVEHAYHGRTWRFETYDLVPAAPSIYALMTLFSGALITLLLSAGAAGWGMIGHLRRQVDAARRLGHYTLAEKLGQGGMGVVYRAQHSLLRRETAVKVLNREADEEAIQRFEREVRITARLTHPNTIAIYDYGRTREGDFYYVMELLHGMNLHELVLRHGPMPAARVIHVLKQVSGALAEAHSVGLIHRDIKPENVMVTCRGREPDFAKVLDFGLVKQVRQNPDDDARITQKTVILGTPHYLAPEAIQSLPFDGRADVYSLAGVAYFMLTATDVFSGNNVMELLMKHVSEPPEPPSRRLGRTIGADFETLLMRCLSKLPEDRPNADTLLVELEALVDVEPWTHRDALAWWMEHHPEMLSLSALQTSLPPSARSTLLDPGPRRLS